MMNEVYKFMNDRDIKNKLTRSVNAIKAVLSGWLYVASSTDEASADSDAHL